MRLGSKVIAVAALSATLVPAPERTPELSDAVLRVLDLIGGWSMLGSNHKCASIPITPETEIYPDLYVQLTGRRLETATSWESGDNYETLRIRADGPYQVVLETSMAGGYEDLSWTGRALWFVECPTSEPVGNWDDPEASAKKASSVTLHSWQGTDQQD